MSDSARTSGVVPESRAHAILFYHLAGICQLVLAPWYSLPEGSRCTFSYHGPFSAHKTPCTSGCDRPRMRTCTALSHARRVSSPCVLSSANCAASLASARRHTGTAPQTLLMCNRGQCWAVCLVVQGGGGRTCNAAGPEAVADGQRDVVLSTDVQDLVPVSVRKVLGVVQQAELRTTHPAMSFPLPDRCHL